MAGAPKHRHIIPSAVKGSSRDSNNLYEIRRGFRESLEDYDKDGDLWKREIDLDGRHYHSTVRTEEEGGAFAAEHFLQEANNTGRLGNIVNILLSRQINAEEHGHTVYCPKRVPETYRNLSINRDQIPASDEDTKKDAVKQVKKRECGHISRKTPDTVSVRPTEGLGGFRIEADPDRFIWGGDQLVYRESTLSNFGNLAKEVVSYNQDVLEFDT